MSMYEKVDSEKVLRTRKMLREFRRDELVEFVEKVKRIDVEKLKKGIGESRLFCDVCFIAKRLANYANACDVLEEFINTDCVGKSEDEELMDFIATGTIGNLM